MSTQGHQALSIALLGDSRPLIRPAIFMGTIYLLSPIILLNKYTHIYEKFQFHQKLGFFCIHFLLALFNIIYTVYI